MANTVNLIMGIIYRINLNQYRNNNPHGSEDYYSDKRYQKIKQSLEKFLIHTFCIFSEAYALSEAYGFYFSRESTA